MDPTFLFVRTPDGLDPSYHPVSLLTSDYSTSGGSVNFPTTP